jgi:hypothetical protein
MVTNGADERPSVFAVYIEELKPPVEKAKGSSPAQKLLDFVQRWGQPTIRVRDFRHYGPGSLRDRKDMADTAEVLVKKGWLKPVPTPHGHKWAIIRKPIIDPTV